MRIVEICTRSSRDSTCRAVGLAPRNRKRLGKHFGNEEAETSGKIDFSILFIGVLIN